MRPLTSSPLAPGSGAVGFLLLLTAALLLLVPAFVNGAPWLFPDSVGYFRAGEATVAKIAEFLHQPGETDLTKDLNTITLADRARDGISNARSPFYGTILVLLNGLLGDWGMVVFQSAVVVICFHFAWSRMFPAGPTLLARSAWILAIGLSALAGLAAFTGLVMPDVFTSLMLLALAMLLAGQGNGTRIGWLLLLLAALLFHKAHLAIAILVVSLAFALQLLRRRSAVQLLPIVAVIALGGFGHWVVGAVVERLSGQPLHNPPFVLARLVADGTASLYLADVCPDSGLLLCQYRDRLPMPAHVFLWAPDPDIGLYRTLPIEKQRIVAAETVPILRGVLLHHPLAQIEASFRNVVGQLATLGVNEFRQPPVPLERMAEVPPMRGLLEGWSTTRIGSNRMPLDAISVAMRVVYAASTLALLAAVVWVLRTPRPLRAQRLADPRVGIVAWLMFGVLVNALVSGVLSGVFERYQGRVAWLLPVAAIGLWCVLLGQPNEARARTRADRLPAQPG